MGRRKNRKGDEESGEEEEKPVVDVEAEAKKKKKKEERKKKKKDKMEAMELASESTEQSVEAEEEDEFDEYAAQVQKKKSKKKKKNASLFTFQEDLTEEVQEIENEAEEEEKVGKDDKKKKRLSNKERKKLREDKQKAEREEEYTRAANPLDGAQFAVSQGAINADSTWTMSKDIHIDNFTINAHNKLLFENASLHINQGAKYGLVGPNGQGKTTLLKMIALGELKIPPKIDNLYVEQEVVADDTRAVDAVLKADKKRWDLLQEEQELLKESDESSDRLNEIYDALESIGASAAEAKARKILYGLGFDSAMQEKPTKEFSGGWRMRISIAKALFLEPTLLMLDEPTNHLDLNAVIWLDDYLQKWKKTLLIVSHDADFLNSVCSDILHLEQRKIVHYKGNYDQFKEMEKQKRKQLQKAWEKQQKQLRSLKASGKSSKKATELVKKKREPGARAFKKKAKESVESSQATDKSSQLIERPREYTVKFSFPETTLLSPPILEVREVSFRYNEAAPYLFKNVDFGVDTDSRICIAGPNGVGKSTLLKVITDELHVKEGEVRRNQRLRLGIYNQHFVDKLPMGETPVEYLRRLFQDENYQSVRDLLGKVGLEGHAHEIKNRLLSGGQKARVVFAELILMRPHILILDEPTNNLDIESIDALCQALNEYNGGVIVVTHDARLIEATDCLLWVVGDQKVIEYDGGFPAYRQEILNDLAKQAQDAEIRLREKAEIRAAEIAAKRTRVKGVKT